MNPNAGTVSLDDLKVFMAAILNFNQPFMKSQEIDEAEERPRVNTQKIGHRLADESDRLALSDEDIAYIVKQFVLLGAARQDFMMNAKKETHLAKVIERVPQAEFRPKTDAKSRKILEKKNPKDQLG